MSKTQMLITLVSTDKDKPTVVAFDFADLAGAEMLIDGIKESVDCNNIYGVVKVQEICE